MSPPPPSVERAAELSDPAARWPSVAPWPADGTRDAVHVSMATTMLLDRPRKLIALRALYVYTIVSAGPIGLWMLLAPSSFAASFALPTTDPYLLGVIGAIYTGFLISAALGLRAPLRFAPVFLFQLFYKALWLVVLFAPRALHGGLPGHAWILAAVFVSFVIFDLLVLPFSAIFSR